MFKIKFSHIHAFVFLMFCVMGISVGYGDDPMTIVTTGGSMTRGYSYWGDFQGSCDAAGLNSNVVMLATSGLNSSQYVGETLNSNDTELRDYAGEVLAADPDVICFMLGTNDTYSDAIATLAKQYDRSSQWVQKYMGQSNDLLIIHENLKTRKLNESSQ